MTNDFEIIYNSFLFAFEMSKENGCTFATQLTVTTYNPHKCEFAIELKHKKRFICDTAKFRFKYVDSCIYVERTPIHELWWESLEDDVYDIIKKISDLYWIDYNF